MEAICVKRKDIKGAKTEGKYTLKGFEKAGKFISSKLSNVKNFINSEKMKKVTGIGLSIGSIYMFGANMITAKLFYNLVIKKCILNSKEKSPLDSLKFTLELNKNTLNKTQNIEKIEENRQNTEDKRRDER